MKYVRPWNLFIDSHKSKSLGNGGRFLGLDVGDKYVGLSLSDSDNKIASPLSVLLRKKSTLSLMAQDFKSLVSELNVEGLIVGYPYTQRRNPVSELNVEGLIDGYPYTQRRNPEAIQVNFLIEDLCKTRILEGVKYTYWDECYTSKNIELLLKPLSFHPCEMKTIFDKFAAVCILQGYLDYANKKLTSEHKPSPLLKSL